MKTKWFASKTAELIKTCKTACGINRSMTSDEFKELMMYVLDDELRKGRLTQAEGDLILENVVKEFDADEQR